MPITATMHKRLLFKRIISHLNKRTACGGGGRKGLVLGGYDGCNPGEVRLTETGTRLDIELGGKISDLLKGMSIKLGEVQVFSNVHNEFDSIAVSGLGKPTASLSRPEQLDENKENIRVSAGVGAMALQDLGVSQIFIEGYTNSDAAAEGSALGVWKYQQFKNVDHQDPNPKLELFDSQDRDSWQQGLIKAAAQNLARTLEEAPANVMTPTNFARSTIDILCPCGVQVEVRDKDWLENKKMNAFLTMARGSCETPLLLEVGYCGGEPLDKPVIFIGKGMTFDTGGLCLKPCDEMSESRADMSGAAVIVATIRAISQMNLPLNVIGLIPMGENMTGGMGMKPGDVLLSLNGKTIRIERTDHDARVVMTDILVYSEFFQPCLDITIASLSSGVKKALGFSSSGVFSTSEIVWRELMRAGADTGDRVWRFPFWKYYSKKVTSYVGVDVNNKGKSKGAACLGAAFLKEFVPKGLDYAHVDITGTGMKSTGVGHPYLRKGLMSGRPTRTMTQFLYQMACPHEKEDEL